MFVQKIAHFPTQNAHIPFKFFWYAESTLKGNPAPRGRCSYPFMGLLSSEKASYPDGAFLFLFSVFLLPFPGRGVSFPPPARPLRALETVCSKKGCKPSTHFPYQGQNYLVCCIQPQKTIALKTQNQFLFICFYHSLSCLQRKTSGPHRRFFLWAATALLDGIPTCAGRKDVARPRQPRSWTSPGQARS